MWFKIAGLKLCRVLAFAMVLWPVAGLTANKTALVIGNSIYQNGPDLRTPKNDSEMIANRFEKLGYDTVLLQDATKADLMVALAELRIRSESSNKVVIYFAGHGLQVAGNTHLLGSDSDFSGAKMHDTMVSLHVLVRAISNRARQKLIFIDACRDNPSYSAAGRPQSRHAKSYSPAGLFVLFASQPGVTVFDGIEKHSPFARSFINHMNSGAEVEDFARRVRVDVIRSTEGLQVPWSRSSLMRPAFLD
jgi:uncharacterized caspase-like protein